MIAVIVLTLNENPRIEDCLKRLRPYVDYLLVLDGGSTDGTIEIARQYADQVEVKPFSGSFGEERNYAQSLLPFWCEWILHVDVDEGFQEGFLKSMKKILAETDADSFRFPRVNLVTSEEAKNFNRSRLSNSPFGLCKDYPDYQVRLMKRNAIMWRGKFHEVPYSITENKLIDQVSCKTLNFPIIHLPRNPKLKRPWW